jgi:hypothetical protein
MGDTATSLYLKSRVLGKEVIPKFSKHQTVSFRDRVSYNPKHSRAQYVGILNESPEG